MVWNHWLLFAWIVPSAWALAAVIDVFLIDRAIYENPLQATAISGFVVALPLILITLPIADWRSVNVEAASLGLASGVCYGLHLLFYYKAMFTVNDAAHTETFLNTEVLIIPVLAFLLLGESLTTGSYLGIALSALGVVILNRIAKGYLLSHRRMTRCLIIAVLASSMGFILQDMLFQSADYTTGLGCYAFGLLLTVAPLAAYSGPTKLSLVFSRYAIIIVSAEVFTLVATTASLRAIDTGPSVSLVAVIESARPLLIMLLCFALWTVLRGINQFNANSIASLQQQFHAAPEKLIACGLIAGGVFFASTANA